MRRLLLLAAAAVANKHDKKHKHHAAADYGDIDAAKAGTTWAPRRPTFGAAGVYARLDASLQKYAAVSTVAGAKASLATVAKHRDDAVLVHGGRVFVTSGFLQKRGEDGADARLRHLRVLAAATKLPGGVPDVLYRYETFSGPDACEAPSLVQYKRQGYDACGVLAPAASLSDVETVPTTRVEERVRKESQRVGSFSSRRDEALWRGPRDRGRTREACLDHLRKLELAAHAARDPSRFKFQVRGRAPLGYDVTKLMACAGVSKVDASVRNASAALVRISCAATPSHRHRTGKKSKIIPGAGRRRPPQGRRQPAPRAARI
jgi:hypothetical protein